MTRPLPCIQGPCGQCFDGAATKSAAISRREDMANSHIREWLARTAPTVLVEPFVAAGLSL